MHKPRVVFPFTEAGLGHIMPMTSIADEFEKLYGDKVEVVRSNFFSETGNKKLLKYEKCLSEEVVRYNRCPPVGFLATSLMNIFGTYLTSIAAIKIGGLGAAKAGAEHFDELKPDLVISTHWATNYYAVHSDCKPLTAMYCPDAKINPLFSYPCDLYMVSMPTGYRKALKNKRKFNENNLKQVPFLIRKQAFEITSDKRALKRKLGLDEDKFTVLVADGGYGVGKCKKTCKELLKRDLPINLVVVCGKNKALYEELKNMKSGKNTVFKPYSLADNMLEIIAASDISCGKSGASLMAEPCFFGVPQIITHYAGDIEKCIGRYYINTVGSAIKQFNVKKACDLIEKFVAYPALLQPYREAALSQKQNYGAQKCARYLFGLLCSRFPELADGTELV